MMNRKVRCHERHNIAGRNETCLQVAGYVKDSDLILDIQTPFYADGVCKVAHKQDQR